jgi:hypothetical protein
MIVERWTWKVKHMCRGEVVELTKAMVEEIGLTPRICTFTFGPWDVVTSDLEFESEEDRKMCWAGIDWSQPATAEWNRRERELVVSATRALLEVR